MCSISEPIRYHLMTICFRFPVDETRLCLQSDQQPYTREWQERHISANLYTFSKLYFSLSTWTVHMHATKLAQTWLVNLTWTTNGKQNLIYWLNSLCFCQPKIPTSRMPNIFLDLLQIRGVELSRCGVITSVFQMQVYWICSVNKVEMYQPAALMEARAWTRSPAAFTTWLLFTL